jgi:hypothetical protein
MAQMRSADCIEQGPLSGATRKHLLALSSSQFDPGADIVPTRAGQGLVFLALALAGERS